MKPQHTVFSRTKLSFQRNGIRGLPLKFVMVFHSCKIKARLLSPSIILPVGKFLAGIRHLRLIQQTFGNDIHNMRAKDIDHKDRQNYDAAMHITSPDMLQMLSEIPDAKGTYIYLEVMRCVMNSYLDKSLDVITRIHKAWYAVFFVRYWRQWLLLNKEYCLSANFITSNAYKCIELNAHSIVTVTMTIRDHLTTDNQCFIPRLLGSQSWVKKQQSPPVRSAGKLSIYRQQNKKQINSLPTYWDKDHLFRGPGLKSNVN